MKNYLDLVPLYTRAHRKQNRMSIFCIFLSVFLVAAIFGMADMYIRSQLIKTRQEDGNWHIALSRISDKTAELIAARPEVQTVVCYGTLNYRLDLGYTVGGKDVVICGGEAPLLTEILPAPSRKALFPAQRMRCL